MGTLREHDFCVAPIFLINGHPARTQIILLYVWMLAGKEWSFKELSALCGCGVDNKILDSLVSDGLLSEVPEADRKDAKPSSRYIIKTDFLPERPEKAVEKPVKKPMMPAWVFAAIEIWKRHHGVISPGVMKRDLDVPVRLYGDKSVLAGLERYAKNSEGRFNPSPSKFAATIKDWIRKEEDAYRPASMLDLR